MGLIGYVKNTATYEGLAPVPPCEGGMFDYVLAAEGIYIHAKRAELEAHFQIGRCAIRGVEPSMPIFGWHLPKVPANLIQAALMEAAGFGSKRLETLFHLEHSHLNPFDEGWTLTSPRQERTATTCRPLDDGENSSHDRAIIEIHSHHSMTAKFSAQDNADETGFRIYGVMGTLDKEPKIRLRVGVYGYFLEIDPTWIMQLPEGLQDAREDWRW